MAGAAAVFVMPGLDAIPGFNLTDVAIEAAAAFASRLVTSGVIAQQVGAC